MINDPPSDPHPDSGRTGPEFRHRSVADALRRRIAEGVLAPASKLPALREIAAEFQVSTMAVRQAIQILEREGQVYRIAGVGAFVRSETPGRPSTAQRMIALAASDLTSAFEMGIARGVERACQIRGWGVQIFDAQHHVDLETRNLLRLGETGAQGAIIIPTWGDPTCVDSLFRVQSSGFPLVFADRIPPGLKADLVESDHEEGAYRATRHLLDHGFSHVVMLTPPAGVSSIASRIQGYQRAMRSAGKSARPEWMAWLDLDVQAEAFRTDRKWFGGYRAILPVLREHSLPAAVFAVDAYTAWGVYEACRELGLRIPDDVSIVGFDDSEIAQAMRPAITIIRQKTEEIGQVAVELLEQRINSPPSAAEGRRSFAHVVVGVELVERQSVASAAPSRRHA